MLALVVFGPRRLPEIGRQIGKLMYEFRKASNEFKYQMEEELRKSEEAESRQKLLEENKKLTPMLGQPSESTVEAAVEPGGGASGAATSQAPGEPAAVDAQGGLKIQPPTTGETIATTGQSAAEIEAEERLSRAGRLSETLVAEGSAEAVEIVSSKRALQNETVQNG